MLKHHKIQIFNMEVHSWSTLPYCQHVIVKTTSTFRLTIQNWEIKHIENDVRLTALISQPSMNHPGYKNFSCDLVSLYGCSLKQKKWKHWINKPAVGLKQSRSTSRSNPITNMKKNETGKSETDPNKTTMTHMNQNLNECFRHLRWEDSGSGRWKNDMIPNDGRKWWEMQWKI